MVNLSKCNEHAREHCLIMKYIMISWKLYYIHYGFFESLVLIYSREYTNTCRIYFHD